ncbi:MAG: lipopolysaccharide core heptose(I) kinase RfaP [Pseudomonadales bacterium]|nr:lipopolysaccharide core heptose(I) kinase RfaP [Pseudomonadales bacterium]
MPSDNPYLNKELSPLLRRDHLFADACRIKGEVFRELEARRTLRFEVNQKRYFVKLHFGAGWREIFKNLLQLRLPVLGASNEWHAASHLSELGIDTLSPVGFVSQGRNPATIRSCLITRALENTQSLEELADQNAIDLNLRRLLVDQIANVARTMHGSGMNHRDFYICHFLLQQTAAETASEIKIFLIDLHRAQLRARTPARWRVKDLAGLLFSSIDADITRNDIFRFMRLYSAKPLRRTMVEDRKIWRSVLQRAGKLYRRDKGIESELLCQMSRQMSRQMKRHMKRST